MMSSTHESRGRALRIATLAVAGLLAGCGTTSELQAPTAAADTTIDLNGYKRLLVEDFKDEATAKAKPEVQPVLKPKVDAALKMFPEQIASVVRAGGGFDEVLRSGSPDSQTLVLRGAITQFDEGNATLRWMVGFAAGNTNFDSRLELIDGGTGNTLGTWIVDKNSWALGGGVAATQRPEDFMQDAAQKIGAELSAKRKLGQIRAPAAKQP